MSVELSADILRCIRQRGIGRETSAFLAHPFEFFWGIFRAYQELVVDKKGL